MGRKPPSGRTKASRASIDLVLDRPLVIGAAQAERLARGALLKLSRRRGHGRLLGELSLGLLSVSRERMRAMNLEHRGQDRPTDVLSFPAFVGIASIPRQGPLRHIGDVVICPAVARGNARRARRSERTEISVLLLHGILHLLGYDHETDDGTMHEVERSLWHDLGLAGLGNEDLL